MHTEPERISTPDSALDLDFDPPAGDTSLRDESDSESDEETNRIFDEAGRELDRRCEQWRWSKAERERQAAQENYRPADDERADDERVGRPAERQANRRPRRGSSCNRGQGVLPPARAAMRAAHGADVDMTLADGEALATHGDTDMGGASTTQEDLTENTTSQRCRTISGPFQRFRTAYASPLSEKLSQCLVRLAGTCLQVLETSELDDWWAHVLNGHTRHDSSVSIHDQSLGAFIARLEQAEADEASAGFRRILGSIALCKKLEFYPKQDG